MDKGVRPIALITGAAGGIGFELARLLAAHPCDLVLVDKREKALASAVELLENEFVDPVILTMAVDLTDAESPAIIQRELRNRGIRIDYLVNNAGFGVLGPFSETDWEREDQMLRLHVLALTDLTKRFVSEMLENGGGKVLNVASVAGFQPSPLMAVYNASKAYVLSFSEAIANELQGTGITVTVLCPGLTRTGFQENVGAGNPDMIKNPLISQSAEYVARVGYQAMMKGQTVAIPGVVNRFFANANRFLPRSTVVKLVRRAQERNRKFLK